MEFTRDFNALQHSNPEIADAIRPLKNLEAILKWARPGQSIDSVQQDEYNYDILVQHDEQRWLSFGCS